MAKCFIFLCIFGDLDHVETGVSEVGINSLKTLPKSSKLLWRVKTLIILRILFAKPDINRPDFFAEPPVSHSTDCQPC